MNFITRKSLIGLLAGALLLSSGLVAWAGTSGDTVSNLGKKIMAAVKPEMQNQALNKLVTDGIITQAQLDAVLAQLPQSGDKSTERKNSSEGLAALVEAGTLTEAQADAIAKVLPGGRQGVQAKPEEALKQLVTAGTITQAQLDAILAQLPQSGDKSIAGKNPTEMLAALVKSGTLTQAQADAVAKVFAPADRPEGMQGKAQPQQALTQLVTAGTITQAQLDTIQAQLFQPGDKSNAGKNPTEVLAALVKDGTLTQAQADAVTKVFSGGRPAGGPEGGQAPVKR